MDEYQQTIRALSDRIVAAQTPIRVLDAVKWDDNIRNGFLKAKGKEPRPWTVPITRGDRCRSIPTR